ncbi:hypothetical protein EYF80_044511 [Liparis tanakae]|uniref:Uncharacterized protein n=1 Tax=Liparis tanakae TaxID=230148 RepID=A0A4Z2FWI2_9TELE|nr:hypothetical protein EYF80_044511 [Liparis tanakae]
MEPALPPPSSAPSPTSRESTSSIRVRGGGGRSNRGPNTALRTRERTEIKRHPTRKRMLRWTKSRSSATEWSRKKPGKSLRSTSKYPPTCGSRV